MTVRTDPRYWKLGQHGGIQLSGSRYRRYPLVSYACSLLEGSVRMLSSSGRVRHQSVTNGS